MPRGRARCDDVRDQALGGAADEQVFSLRPWRLGADYARSRSEAGAAAHPSLERRISSPAQFTATRSGFDPSVRAGRLVRRRIVGRLLIAVAVRPLLIAIGRLLVAGEWLRRVHLDLHRRNPPLLVLALLPIALAIPLAVAGIHVEVGRRCRARLAVLLPVALRIHDAEIMLSVLIEVFRRDAVAARLRLPRHRDIALEHLIRVAAYLDARPVALKALGAVGRAWSSPAAAAAVVMRHAAAVAAA